MTTPTEPNVIFTGMTIEIGDVGDVIITDPVQDEDTGDWLRDIRIFGETGTNDEKQLLLTIKVRGDTRTSILATAPESEF